MSERKRRVLAALKAVKVKIANDKCWCRRAIALTKEGAMCSPNDPAAAQWCLAGAVSAVIGGRDGDTIWHAFEYLVAMLPKQADPQAHPLSLGEYNDISDHADVIGLLTRAITALEIDLRNGAQVLT